MKKLVPVLTGGILLILSVLGLWLLGRVLNPRAQEILVATTDLEPSAHLSAEAVQVVSVNMNQEQLANYLTPSLLEDSGYQVQVIQPVARGNFIPLQALSFDSNPAAMSHTSLALSDPGIVAMVIPVTPLTCPPDVKPGDMVSLSMDLGSSAFMAGEFSAVATPQSYSSLTSSRPPTVLDSPGSLITSPLGEPTATPTAPALLTLPITKNITTAKVLKVLYEIKVTGSLNTTNDTEQGKITGLVVGVAAEAQEMIGFGIHNGEIRVAVLSPQASAGMASAGMSYDDMVAYFRWNRQLWLLDGSISMPNISAPGAAVIYPTLMATYFPSPTMQPSPTHTATPSATGPTPTTPVRP